MHIDFSRAWNSFQTLVNSLIASLPNLALSLVILLLFLFIGKWARWGVARITLRKHHPSNVAILLGRLLHVIVIVIGVLVSLSVLLPSFKASDLIQVLGIGGVAIGFAFKDIFQNFLAGILILLNHPFRVGDNIRIDSYEGTVEDIQTRATLIRTFDGQRVVIPNTVIFTNSLVVETAFDKVRKEVQIGIGYDSNPSHATDVVLQTLAGLEDIEKQPQPQVLAIEAGDYTLNLRLRYWIGARLDPVLVRDKVLRQVMKNLIEAGVSLPYPTQTVMLQPLPRAPAPPGSSPHQ